MICRLYRAGHRISAGFDAPPASFRSWHRGAKTAIARFGEAEGLTIIGEYVEAETEKRADALDRRPQLAAALSAVRSPNCVVLVSKLDRLSRDVAFVSGLMV